MQHTALEHSGKAWLEHDIVQILQIMDKSKH